MELRKRRSAARANSDGLSPDAFASLAADRKNVIFFSGSGMSATSGMSMFSTRNGLYERARKRFKIQDGIKLFTYSFYKSRKADVQAFFAQIYSEAQASKAAAGHHALAEVHELRRLCRHYTLNIDGLSEVVGLDTWHHERNPGGITVEMHGNIRQLVCPGCHFVEPLSRAHINMMKAQQPVPCQGCQQEDLRFKVMLYDDDEGDCITPEHVFDVLEEDLKVADMVIWVGISFEQSASVEYFRKVRHLLGQCGRLQACMQVLINPSEEPYFNLLSALCNTDDLPLVDVRATSDEMLPLLAERMRQHACGALEPSTAKEGEAAAEETGSEQATGSGSAYQRGVDDFSMAARRSSMRTGDKGPVSYAAMAQHGRDGSNSSGGPHHRSPRAPSGSGSAGSGSGGSNSSTPRKRGRPKKQPAAPANEEAGTSLYGQMGALTDPYAMPMMHANGQIVYGIGQQQVLFPPGYGPMGQMPGQHGTHGSGQMLAMQGGMQVPTVFAPLQLPMQAVQAVQALQQSAYPPALNQLPMLPPQHRMPQGRMDILPMQLQHSRLQPQLQGSANVLDMNAQGNAYTQLLLGGLVALDGSPLPPLQRVLSPQAIQSTVLQQQSPLQGQLLALLTGQVNGTGQQGIGGMGGLLQGQDGQMRQGQGQGPAQQNALHATVTAPP